MKLIRTDPEVSPLMKIYDLMSAYFGPRGWWPGDSNFEICVGAILTQSVSWKNTAKAISNLKNAGLLDLKAMHCCPQAEIEKCIVPAMYFRTKARKLKAFVSHVMGKYNGDLSRMLARDGPELREELLAIYGIGPETADSMILYAAGKRVFVVDAYTRRIFSRLGFYQDNISYTQMQEFFMHRLPPEVPLYNEFHALIVGIGNRFCSSRRPKCQECPLREFCNYSRREEGDK